MTLQPCASTGERSGRRRILLVEDEPFVREATCIILQNAGSACEGNRTVGTQALTTGNPSSSHDRNAPTQPSASAIVSGRIKKPPRRLYIAWRITSGSFLLRDRSSVATQPHPYNENRHRVARTLLSAPASSTSDASTRTRVSAPHG